MAMSIDTIMALPEYTPAVLLKLTNFQIAQILATGQATGIDGNSLTRADLTKLQKLRSDLMTEVQSESDETGGIALAQFGNPQ